MDASIQPYLIVRRPTHVSLACAFVRFRACAAVAGDGHTPKSPTRPGTHGGHRMRLTGACVAEASSPRADKRRVLAFLMCVRRAGTRSYGLVRCAGFSSLKTLPFEDGTSRRLLRRRSLVTAGRSRRRSHLRLHIPGVHCCTPVFQGESIRRPVPALPGSSDRDDSTFTSISVSGLIIIRPAQSLYRTH